MEVVTGKKIKDILLHNNTWWRFFISLKKLIRPDIITNIIKILACRNAFLGYRLYKCFSCNHIKPVFHTCKSSFCSTCGKKAYAIITANNLAARNFYFSPAITTCFLD